MVGAFMKQFLRSLDRLRRQIMHPLIELIFRTNREIHLPLDPDRIRRVLVIRHDGLGDAITTLPALHLLRRLLPAATIDVWCSPRNAQVLAALPDVSRLWVWDGRWLELFRLLPRLRREQYDLIMLTVRNKSTLYALHMKLVAAPHTIRAAAFRGEQYHHHFDFQSHSASTAPNEWESGVNLVAELFGYTPSEHDVQPFFPTVTYSWRRALAHLRTFGLGSGQYVVVNLSAHSPRNRWGAEQLSSTVHHLRSLNLPIVACGIRADINRFGHILTEHGIYSYPPTSDIHQIAALIAHARCLVTPDTGVVHIATALGVPLVALYTSDGQSEYYWAPYRHRCAIQLLALRGSVVASIPAERILEATLSILNQIATTTAAL